jgi:hypothetical protein
VALVPRRAGQVGGLVHAALDALLPWDLKRRLDAEAPTHFEAPTGSRIAASISPKDIRPVSGRPCAALIEKPEAKVIG